MSFFLQGGGLERCVVFLRGLFPTKERGLAHTRRFPGGLPGFLFKAIGGPSGSATSVSMTSSSRGPNRSIIGILEAEAISISGTGPSRADTGSRVWGPELGELSPRRVEIGTRAWEPELGEMFPNLSEIGIRA